MRMMALRPSSSEGNWRKHVNSIGDIFTACNFPRPETDDRTCYRVKGYLDPRARLELFRRCWCGFRGSRYGLLKTVGYENAGYGYSADRKGDIEAGFGRED